MALALGFKSPERMMEELSASEYSGWVHYFQHENFPFLQLDIHLARLSYFTLMGATHGKSQTKPQDLMLSWVDISKPTQSPQTMKAILESLKCR